MLIASYNQKQLGDVLIVITGNGENKKIIRKSDVVKILDSSNKPIGYNFFNISKFLKLDKSGQIILTKEDVEKLNKKLLSVGFTPNLTADLEPKFVVGLVEELKKHPDSDHLQIAKIKVDSGSLQIVCGAPNIKKGQRVVVAKVGAMMPNGLIILPNKLRGIDSFGMVCSARELNLPNAPQKRGILVLDSKYEVGSEFKDNK